MTLLRLAGYLLLTGWVAGNVGFIAGCLWAGIGRPPDGTCHNCQDVVGRLSAELAREAANTQLLGRLVAAQHGYIDQLEHEQAIDGGATLGDEAERFLAEGGGS